MENRPIILDIEEYKTNLIQCINDAIQKGIPCYLMEPILSDVYGQVKGMAQKELAMAKEQMKDKGVE